MLYTFKQKSTKKIILNFTYSTPRKENGDPYWNLPYNSHFYFGSMSNNVGDNLNQ